MQKQQQVRKIITPSMQEELQSIAMGGVITQSQAQSYVDEGQELNAQLKIMKAKAEMIRGKLMEYAKAQDIKEIYGTKAKASIKQTTSTNIDPGLLKTLLTKLKKMSLFNSLIGVKITDAKKYLGEENLRPISQITTEEYGSISYKEL